ncbi:zinc finger CCCH domain-containing protein 3 isoform X2 [Tribolium madens]|uniref:zinc finger CCCH domain-containing protein 3 isoform X2 n=1 Tax=Tribolium madens TaxID=41895 RepID=UPI001CF74834|nr:zinc finger CCCH domain-containing protein 3 isoform X2 [Tribolium madens]
MNYYQPMNHQTQFHFPQYNPANVPNSSTNRFIYVKHNFVAPNPAPKVLVNPHFKKKVYVNPQFKPPQNPVPTPSAKPKIHINPNVLKNFAKTVNTVPRKVSKVVETPKSTTVISTRNKLIRIPCNSPEVRKRRNSLHTKYKIVRNGAKNGSLNRFKLDKRHDKSANKSIVRSAKKRYVYVNRFLSIDVMAKNVLLKKNSNLSKPGFVNINGILYKKSPNSLRKASDTSLLKSRTFTKSSNSRRSLVKRYKLIRSKKPTPSKLRKCNIPCPIFRKYGKCPGKAAGTCFKLHNPDQIILCTRFLQGACRNEKCLLSHKVSLEKMPTCKYFLDGLCSKDNCPYLHVRISPKADICKDFLEGFCKKGAECNKRHQFLCPEFEKNKKCAKRRCPYPHGNTVRKNSKVLNRLAKKCSTKKAKKEPVLTDAPEKNRYYKEKETENKCVNGEENVIKTVSKDRPKLGVLPAFIPFQAT